MKRYQHIYGGTATVVGTYPKREVHKYLSSIGVMVPLPMSTTPEKVVDCITHKREVLVYTTRRRGWYQIEVINR